MASTFTDVFSASSFTNALKPVNCYLQYTLYICLMFRQDSLLYLRGKKQ